MAGELEIWDQGHTIALQDAAVVTPKNRDKDLPPSPTDDGPMTSTPQFYSPLPWSTPRMESSERGNGLTGICDSMDTMVVKPEEDFQHDSSPISQAWLSPLPSLNGKHQSPQADLSDSPVSYMSSQNHSSLYSSRFSSSTLASSAERTISDGSTTASPNGYGFALGSPKKDNYVGELDTVDVETAGGTAIGLGLSSHQLNPVEQFAASQRPVGAPGPFSHHRAPSWTLSSSSSLGGKSSLASQVPATIQEAEGSSLLPRPPLAINVPSRNASRSQSSSSMHSSTAVDHLPSRIRNGSKQSFTSTLSRNISMDEVYTKRPSTAQSISSISNTSSSTDFPSKPLSPRTSSLKKSKTRPSLTTKASEPLMATQRPRFHSQPSRAPSSSLIAVDDSRVSTPTIFPPAPGHANQNIAAGRVTEAPLESSNPFQDYLFAVHNDDGFFNGEEAVPDVSLAVTLTEEGKGVFVQADGKDLSEVEGMVGSRTTHLLLSGCQDASMLDFLERALPVMRDSLLVLDVSDTGLTELPDSLCHCSRLEELNVSMNPLCRSWKGHGLGPSLANLRILLADDCQLSVLPREIGDLRGLKTLSVRRNDLSHLPSWLYRLHHLEGLFVEGNSFQGAWKQICEAFAKEPADRVMGMPWNEDLARPAIGRSSNRGPSSAPCRTNDSLRSVFHWDGFGPSTEALEEIADEPPITAPATMSKAKEERGPKRPLIRRMLSNNSEAGLRGRDEEPPTMPSESSHPSSRRPSIGATEMGEKKWETLMRKLARKASNSQLTGGDVAMTASKQAESACPSPVRSRSNSVVPEAPAKQTIKITYPLTPVGWQDSSNDSPMAKSAGEARARKRSSFLAISQTIHEGQERRKVRALMQYLQDLDDLSALRAGPPGSVMPMEVSMASQYSTPVQTNATFMHRSGSETSRESSRSDTSSSSQGPSDVANVGAKDDAHRRIHILQELIATEQSYIRGLQELVDIYVIPSGAVEPNSGHRTVPSSERRKVFGNIEGILHFHQGAFLPALESAARLVVNPTGEEREERQRLDASEHNALTAAVSEQVALVFSRHAAFFRMYSAYVNNVDTAQTRVSHWKMHKTSNGTAGITASSPAQQVADCNSTAPVLSPKERKRIKAFLQRARTDPRHSQLSLETYLHLPVQRIPRYRLLFEDLVRSCPAHRLKDPGAIASALESICSIATLMNESKRQSEKDRKLLEWQSRVRGYFPSPLVQPHRRLIRDGTLSLKRVVMRTAAFHMTKSQMVVDGESGERMGSDGAVSESDPGVVQVDCLDQQCMDTQVSLLLCNDITVVLVHDSFQPQGNTAPVDLFAVLRIQGAIQIIGQTTLRVVDPKHILYFSASSAAEAQEWKADMMSVNQETRPTIASHSPQR